MGSISFSAVAAVRAPATAFSGAGGANGTSGSGARFGSKLQAANEAAHKTSRSGRALISRSFEITRVDRTRPFGISGSS
jgi:hypothetical protein